MRGRHATRTVVVVVVVVAPPPKAQPLFPSRLALQYPEEEAECFVPPIPPLPRLEAKWEIKSERPRDSQGISDEEPFLKLQRMSEISSGISHGGANDQRSEAYHLSRGGKESRICNKRALFDE